MKRRTVSLIVLAALAALVLFRAAPAAALSEAYEWYCKGGDYEDSGELEKAIECYTKAIELNPRFDEPYRCRGKCY